jgi:hypothetical protein
MSAAYGSRNMIILIIIPIYLYISMLVGQLELNINVLKYKIELQFLIFRDIYYSPCKLFYTVN